MTKYVYMFSEGNANMRELLGGKGANLAEMTGMGLPVPQGFTITTEACNRYYDEGGVISEEIIQEIVDAMKEEEERTGKVFGDPEKPLLVSVRSGSRASMPGMMDTVLNLGLNDEVVEGLAKLTENERFAYDSYRRFIMMFADVVMEVHKDLFEEELDRIKAEKGVKLDLELTADDMKTVVKNFKAIYEREKGEAFPQDPMAQLMESITAVFRSWNNPRALFYRQMNNIPSKWGTAVNVQEMVYGNMGETSGTGVAFTRDPATGENVLYGEYLINAQGEDVVAGVRTPEPISHLQDQFPDIYDEFKKYADELELHYGDMQDLEFTIENGKLFILQTRSGKRTASAALKIAVDMVAEGILSREEAILHIDPSQLDALMHPMFEEKALAAADQIAKGLPASPGAATGKIVFSADQAFEMAKEGEKVILVRDETSAEDIHGMSAAEGILTARGGMTSHAAVVARGMGKCCVAGSSDISINYAQGTMKADGRTFHAGDWISLDGSTGTVYAGQIATKDAEQSDDFVTVMEWADEFREMDVRANADSGHDAQVALGLGAQGIGLTRTEHMFFDPERIFSFRRMIVAKDEETRREALAAILPDQKQDFLEIFRVMDGKPVVIRLLDPPLHEFLPQEESEVRQLAKSLDMDLEELKSIIAGLSELNPMLGHRGCRLAISFPEIAEMQTKAIIGAAIEATKEGVHVIPEIMVPLVSDVKELEYLNGVIKPVADKMIAESGVQLAYMVGTMLEIPRAAMTSDEIAPHADFFSFGTNDLTQMGYGLSRDDAGPILDTYYEKGIFEADPTAHIDRAGIGRLMRIACEDGRKARPDLELGICGEHGGDPYSVEYCQMLKLDYVSCSPYRVPIARLAAAQAALRYPRNKK
ncbi:MAG: pyruvate, phosphate dikinase [Eubacteriales bacterium]|nr:pyruvate, phosphate dikinase [Eubacteriales bacterium]